MKWIKSFDKTPEKFQIIVVRTLDRGRSSPTYEYFAGTVYETINGPYVAQRGRIRDKDWMFYLTSKRHALMKEDDRPYEWFKIGEVGEEVSPWMLELAAPILKEYTKRHPPWGSTK